MNILITGALGYLGSELVKKLGKNSHELVLVDNLYNNNKNIIKTSKKIKFIKKDIEKLNFNNHLKKIDLLIHLASISNTTMKKNDFSKIINTNLKSLDKIINACKEHKVKLLYISTTTVYGKQKVIVNENLNKDFYKPYNLYSKTKLLAEKKLDKYKKTLKFSILRLGTLYGVSQNIRYDTAIQKILKGAKNEQSLMIEKKNYKSKKSYLSINDAIRAIKFIIRKNLFEGEIFNISGINHSFYEIIKIIKKEKPQIKVKFTNKIILGQTPCNISPQKIIRRGFKFRDNIKKLIPKMLNSKNF